MEIEMTVRLLVPDTTALTAFRAIEKMGIKSVRKLMREDYYKFGCEGDFEKLSAKLGKTDIIVNANKHRYNARRPGGPMGEGFPGLRTVRVIVYDTENNDGGLLPILRDRLGFSGVNSVEKGVLWSLGIECKSKEEAEGIARDVAEGLLSNKHYQSYNLIGY
jgi:phosphoribosylformylglycinamidine (FGAM) synthase PurS component